MGARLGVRSRAALVLPFAWVAACGEPMPFMPIDASPLDAPGMDIVVAPDGGMDAGDRETGAVDASAETGTDTTVPRDDGDTADAMSMLDVPTAMDVPPPSDVEVIITADNAYSFGYGTSSAITTWFAGTRALTAGQIFNCPVGVGPEQYVVPATAASDSAFLYIVSWDDLAVTQGVIGQFSRGGTPVYTGSADWEVCATGIDFSRSTVGPTQPDVNTQIATCNAGSGGPTTNGGWVNLAGAVTPGATGTLAVGEMNDTAGGTFPQVCPASAGGIDVAARWMWYQPGGIADPFRSTGTNTFRAYLIFRLRVGNIPPITHGGGGGG